MNEIRKILAAKSELKDRNFNENKADTQELAEIKKLERLFRKSIFEAEHGDKTECIFDVILDNATLCASISDIPCDELRIILDEAVNNQDFIDLFNSVINGSKKLLALQ